MSNNLLARPSVGSWITIAHPTIAEIMAASGFDWLAVDLEHSAITIREAEELIRIIELNQVVPFVRLTSSNPDQIKRVMDSGAHGVIVPMVNDKRVAEVAVAATKYPPIGNRSYGLARAQKYGHGFEEYVSWQASNAMVVVQIEHIDAVNNLEEILLVDGVDAYFVGPYDLSGSLGIPGQFSHPDFVSAMERIKSVAEAVGKPGGVHIIEPDGEMLQDALAQGYQFVAYSLDFKILDSGSRAGLKAWRKICD